MKGNERTSISKGGREEKKEKKRKEKERKRNRKRKRKRKIQVRPIYGTYLIFFSAEIHHGIRYCLT